MSLETEIQKLREAIEANTVALSNQPTPAVADFAKEVSEANDASQTEKKPSSKKPKVEKKVEEKPTETQAPEVTLEDLRKLAGELVAKGKKNEFKAVLDSFEAENLTLFSRAGVRMPEMLTALEEAAGCKLSEIVD